MLGHSVSQTKQPRSFQTVICSLILMGKTALLKSMANTHAFQEHILSGKGSMAAYVFFKLAKVRAEGTSQLFQAHDFSS